MGLQLFLAFPILSAEWRGFLRNRVFRYHLLSDDGLKLDLPRRASTSERPRGGIDLARQRDRVLDLLGVLRSLKFLELKQACPRVRTLRQAWQRSLRRRRARQSDATAVEHPQNSLRHSTCLVGGPMREVSGS